MPFNQRYSNIKNGGFSLIGNTLGLSKASNANAPGTLGSIGAFTSLNTALQVGNFPPGTTLDYTQNGSAATLNLPAGSSILYAELVWGGLFRSTVNNISSLLGNAVQFITPAGTVSVLPDAQTAQNFNITNDGVTVGFYVRSANVTALVKSGMNGVYSTGSVPALIEALDARTSETNHAGWTLAVAYENAALPLRDLTLWCGGTVVSPSTGSTDITLTGFITPNLPSITGKLFISSQEGDAVLTGDQMLFGETLASLTPVSGPNNPVNNFFASQINNDNGLLDTSGTFGTRNANAAAGTNTSACRQGWDITAVDVSTLLSSGMTTAAMRFTTEGDLYVPNCLALQIDSEGAQLQAVKSANKSFAAIGEPVEYTVAVTNTGNLQADTVSVNDFLPNDTVLVAGSISLNGIPYPDSLPVNFGPLAAGATATIRFSAQANALPAQNPVFDIARVAYTFSPFPGETVSSSSDSNFVAVFIIAPLLQNEKSVDKAVATQGEELTYTSIITNRGNLPISNLQFIDPIPIGTSFIQGSVQVNGTPQPLYNPATGFPLPNLIPGQSVTVAFRVKIN